MADYSLTAEPQIYTHITGLGLALAGDNSEDSDYRHLAIAS